MNIEKLAKHLKEFTLDEINMIAECDVENELKQLLNSNNIVFQQGVYKYVEITLPKYRIFSITENYQSIIFDDAVNYFLTNYVAKHCKKKTYRIYNGSFKYDILPFFKGKTLNDITIFDIKDFYQKCISMNFKAERIKNTLALLKQLIKYFQELGFIKPTCNFQVRRLTSKNEFSINRIIFEGESYEQNEIL